MTTLKSIVSVTPADSAGRRVARVVLATPSGDVETDYGIVPGDGSPIHAAIEAAITAGTAAVVAPVAHALTKPQLAAYANAKWAKVIAAGTVTAGGFSSRTDESSQGYVSRAIQLSQAAPATAILWNGVTPITAAQLAAVGTAIGVYVQHAFVALGTVQTGIAAGTIISTAMIDANGWPA